MYYQVTKNKKNIDRPEGPGAQPQTSQAGRDQAMAQLLGLEDTFVESFFEIDQREKDEDLKEKNGQKYGEEKEKEKENIEGEGEKGEISSALSDIAPAAGPQAPGPRGGYGFGSVMEEQIGAGDLLAGISAGSPFFSFAPSLGPIDPTSLQYGLPQISTEILFFEPDPSAVAGLNDVPVANHDLNFFDKDLLVTLGDVVFGINGGGVGAADIASEDGGNRVSEIAFDRVFFPVPEEGLATHFGEFGFVDISSDGFYSYTFPGQPSVTKAFVPQESDVAGVQSSLTLNGITVAVAPPAPGSTVSPGGDLTWVDFGFGAGIGIGGNGRGNPTVFPRGEAISVDPDLPAAEMTVTLADINPSNGGNELSLSVFLDGVAGPQDIVILSPDPTPADGLWSLTLDRADFGDQLIDRVELYNALGANGPVSFTINQVASVHPTDRFHDIFTYTYEDVDGDFDRAALVVGDTGGDVLIGDAGDDALTGSVLGDLLYGGGGSDFLTGADGGDDFLFLDLEPGALDRITDFNPAEGDRLDISFLLEGYDAFADLISDFVIFTENAGDTTVSLDQAGTGNAANAQPLVVLENTAGLDPAQLVVEGALLA